MFKLFDFKKSKAAKLHDEAQRLSDKGEDDEAIQTYLRAIAFDPEKSESYYNLGLIYKYRCEWQKSFEFNQKANELNPDDEAARWNLAIAATALGNWAVARKKWIENGITLDGEEGPIEMDFGATPIRIAPDGDAEVVWARRIDPARARIESIPLPESGYRYGDLVLHDGAAVGYRKQNDREYPVFNVLEIITSSAYETYSLVVSIESEADLTALDEIFSALRSAYEDWTTNIRSLCRACSEGRPHDDHDHELVHRWKSERRLGVALCPDESIERILRDWQEATRGKVLSVKAASPKPQNET